MYDVFKDEKIKLPRLEPCVEGFVGEEGGGALQLSLSGFAFSTASAAATDPGSRPGPTLNEPIYLIASTTIEAVHRGRAETGGEAVRGREGPCGGPPRPRSFRLTFLAVDAILPSGRLRP